MVFMQICTQVLLRILCELGLMLKHQADFWVLVQVSHLLCTGDSDGNPRLGLLCFVDVSLQQENPDLDPFLKLLINTLCELVRHSE